MVQCGEVRRTAVQHWRLFTGRLIVLVLAGQRASVGGGVLFFVFFVVVPAWGLDRGQNRCLLHTGVALAALVDPTLELLQEGHHRVGLGQSIQGMELHFGNLFACVDFKHRRLRHIARHVHFDLLAVVERHKVILLATVRGCVKSGLFEYLTHRTGKFGFLFVDFAAGERPALASIIAHQHRLGHLRIQHNHSIDRNFGLVALEIRE
mmetsp:Transcript_33512/g.57440  ORF Transcript_33512/g.57440 Transcript_33512/m.57440 type:complete len:207 (-) Transcript_33512:341-961(-)